jgi:hypothetical protein
MTLGDLDRDERLALVALIRAIALADGSVSAAEARMVPDIADAIGAQAYREDFALALERFPDEASLKAFVQGVGRPIARELIYRTVADLAEADDLADEELTLLRWLSATWEVGAPAEL